ncbi:general odorant-binding protein 56a-like [Macrosteles quadrilineatus]|uniref:general odorant-binding protein 56a-like n=1 Tax=Macrosteles quadrilineatus TaxID=74068 RepID=UPI0023E2FF27|nr:general odorant-binding protein 56a-like [Macrosteles quadrilineatus]
MKSFAFVVLVVLCVWATKLNAFENKAMKETFAKCAMEQKLTKDDIEKLSKKENLTDERYKCLAKCVGEKEGVIKDGKYNKEGAIKIAKKMFSDDAEKLKKAEEVAGECDETLKDIQSKECDFGPAVIGCLVGGAKEKKIMPDKME